MQELEYPDGHTSKSIYVAMPITALPDSLTQEQRQQLEGAALTIWTTTPWTIPANAAVAVNADLTYCVAQTQVSLISAALLQICSIFCAHHIPVLKKRLALIKDNANNVKQACVCHQQGAGIAWQG